MTVQGPVKEQQPDGMSHGGGGGGQSPQLLLLSSQSTIALSVPALAFTLVYLRSTGEQSRRFL